MADRKIHVLAHVAGMNHYREIVAEMMGLMVGSGLYDAAESITFCMVGAKVATTVSYLTYPKVCVEYGGDLDEWEYPTLRLLYDKAKERPDDRFCYVHTKGASRADDDNSGMSPHRKDRRFCNAWRRTMAYYAIERWRDCLAALESSDTCGAYHIQGPPGHAHYSGNFWWATGEYINRLEYPAPRPIDQHPRMFAEIWLLTGGGSVHNFCDGPGGVNVNYGREFYRGTR